MVDHLTRRLRNIKKKASIIGFGINYSKAIGGGFGHTVKLDKYTGDTNEIVEICLNIFDKYYENLPIRKVSIYLSGLTDINGVQLNLFESFENIILKDKVDKAVDLIKEKYGANSLLKASSLLSDSTIITRNLKNGEEKY
jgi:DNA polymerase V